MESSLKKINPAIRRYIGNEILPQYQQLKGHTNIHITDVIRRSLKIAENLDNINLDMVYVIAAYHDLGRLVDNETHHLESAKMLRADQTLKTFFSPVEIKTMAEAVEDHRASLPHDPRNLYGKIVSSADRSCDITEILIRAYDYNKTLHPDFTEEETIENIRLVLRGKYIPGAYGAKKMYFKNPEFDEFLKQVDDITSTPEKFYQIQTEFNRHRFASSPSAQSHKITTPKPTQLPQSEK